MWSLLRAIGPRPLAVGSPGGIDPTTRTQFAHAQSAATAAARAAAAAPEAVQAGTHQAAEAVQTLIKDETKVLGKDSPEVARTQEILNKLQAGEKPSADDLQALQGVVQRLGQKLLDTAKNKALIDSISPELKSVIANSPNADRALETYAQLKGLQKADKHAPPRPSDDEVRLLTAAVADPARAGALNHAGVLGQDGAVRAAKALQGMSDADYGRAGALLGKAGSDLEKQLLLKAVGSSVAGYTPINEKSPTKEADGKRNEEFFKQLDDLAGSIRGKDRDQVLAKATLPESLKQFLQSSCGPTTLQMLLETMSPIVAKQLNENDATREAWQKQMLEKYGSVSARRDDSDNFRNLDGGARATSTAISMQSPDNPLGNPIVKAQDKLLKSEAEGSGFQWGGAVYDKFKEDPGYKFTADQRQVLAMEVVKKYASDPAFQPTDAERQLLNEGVAHLQAQQPPVDIDMRKLEGVRHGFVQQQEDVKAVDLLRKYQKDPSLQLTPEQTAQVERAKTLVGTRASEAYVNLRTELDDRGNELGDIQANDHLPQAKKDKAWEDSEAVAAVGKYIEQPGTAPDAKQLAQIKRGLELIKADHDPRKTAQIVALRLQAATPGVAPDDQAITRGLEALGLPADAAAVARVRAEATTIREQAAAAAKGVEAVRKGVEDLTGKTREPLDKQVVQRDQLQAAIAHHREELGNKPPAPALATLGRYLTDPDFQPAAKDKVQIEAALRFLKGTDPACPSAGDIEGIRGTLELVAQDMRVQAMEAGKPFPEAQRIAKERLAAEGLTKENVTPVARDRALDVMRGGNGMALGDALKELTGREYREDSVCSLTDDPKAKEYGKALQIANQARAGRRLTPEDLKLIDRCRKMGDVQPAHLDRAANSLAQGKAVPFRVGYCDEQGHGTGGGHFMLLTNVTGAAPSRQFMVADPWSGKATWVGEKDFKSGAFTSDPAYGFNLGRSRVTTTYNPKS